MTNDNKGKKGEKTKRVSSFADLGKLLNLSNNPDLLNKQIQPLETKSLEKKDSNPNKAVVSVSQANNRSNSYKANKQNPTNPSNPNTYNPKTNKEEYNPKTNKEDNNPKNFHNPYNFVPALPRDKVTSDLGDSKPVSHERYHLNRFSGYLRVNLTVKTPLLIIDAANEKEDGNKHKTFPIRINEDGTPLIPATSLKGMLRAAYEAITNSRLSVFSNHKNRLAYRMKTKEANYLKPVYVEVEVDSSEKVIIHLMKSASLKRYNKEDGNITGLAVKYSNGKLPKHGDKVKVWLMKSNKGSYSVDKISLIEEPTDEKFYTKKQFTRDPVYGYVCITSQENDGEKTKADGTSILHNASGKHSERVFFVENPEAPIELNLEESKEIKKQWENIINNYADTHAKELKTNKKLRPLGQETLDWSRHITEAIFNNKGEKLVDGTLCYAAINGSKKIMALYPVMISRKLYDSSPADLLNDNLKPANSIENLSPAERVFGWVNQDGQGAYKGNIRISNIKCITEANKAKKIFEKPLPLAILGQPKPQQVRFYVAANKQGDAQQDKLSSDRTGYSLEKGLRGRKVYPHHNLPNDYWTEHPRQNLIKEKGKNFYQEYRRPQKNGEDVLDSQNRSVKAWIEPDTSFSFDIHITNLSKVELGALIWLLRLEKNHFHRLGGGKPLGFGSVHLDLIENESDIRIGKEWQQIYESLDIVNNPSSNIFNKAINAYKKAVEQAYGNGKPFKEISFIAAFLQSTLGSSYGLPTHYPRIKPATNPEGESFKWFTENEKNGNWQSLRDLWKDGQPDLGLLLNKPEDKAKR